MWWPVNQWGVMALVLVLLDAALVYLAYAYEREVRQLRTELKLVRDAAARQDLRADERLQALEQAKEPRVMGFGGRVHGRFQA